MNQKDIAKRFNMSIYTVNKFLKRYGFAPGRSGPRSKLTPEEKRRRQKLANLKYRRSKKGKEYFKKYRAEHQDDAIKRHRNYRLRRKKILVEMLGGKCQICGYDKCLQALEFHHIEEDINTKQKRGVAYWTSKFNPKNKNIHKILKKIKLVCANCHRELHYQN